MPVKWMEWGTEAFERSRKEKKPVLLDIHGVWCHWCHVADKTTYSDPLIIKEINDNFVPIKVDTDRRPDINERYNQGGWPTTVFLDCNGNIITGATYVPPHEFGFMLEQVKNFYEKNAEKIPQMMERERKPVEIDLAGVSEEVSMRVKESFDVNYGGFGHGQKFPMSEVIEFCILMRKDSQFKMFALMTLDKMKALQDAVEGGFFRYSVSPDWSVPHYEKMLEGNAEVIRSYVHGYALTGKKEYADIAKKAIGYVMKNLAGDGFYGSQDADEEYYSLGIEERSKREKPSIDKTIFTNFNAKMISALMEASVFVDASYRKTALEVLGFILENLYSKEKGFRHCAGGEYGLLTDNSQMLKALLDVYEITRDKKCLDIAKETASFIEKNFFDGVTLNDRIHGNDIGILHMRNRNLAENAAVADSFIRLAFYTDDDSFRDRAEKILKDLGDVYGMYGMMAAPYALAIERLNGVQVKLHCSAPKYEEALKIFNPLRMIIFMGEGRFAAGICKGTVCMQPANSMEELRKVLS